MIPRRIKLRNFLSYRECALDFSGLHVAVLTGRNGDGKSSLLDAITWALWGEARGRYEDDRIYLGEDEMLVDFEFELDGDLFQVIRKRTRGKGSGALDFFQVDRDGYRMPRSGGTMRETQAEINARLRMDYATFVNSAFVAQGRADEFTRKAPADRKEIFRKILGLEFYEALSVRANERRKEAETLASERERLLGDAARDAEQLPQVEAEVEALIKAQAELEPRVCSLDERVTELRLAVADRQSRLRALDEATLRRVKLAADIETLDEEIADAERGCAELRGVLADAAAVTTGFERLQRLRVEERDLAALQARDREAEERLQALQRTIDQERVRLEARRDELRKQAAARAELAAKLPQLRVEEQGIKADRRALGELDDRIEATRKAVLDARARAEKARAEAANDWKRAQEYKENQQRLEGESICPVCRQPLRPADVERLLHEYSAERRALGERYRARQEEAKRADEEAAALDTSIAALVAEREQRDHALRQRETELHRLLTDATAAADELPLLRAELDRIEGQLARGEFAAEARAAAAAAQEMRRAIGYDDAAYQAVRAQIRELEPFEARFHEVAVAKERLARLEETLVRDRTRRSRMKEELAHADEAVRAAREAVDATEDFAGELEQAERALGDLRAEQQSLALRLGSAQARRDELRNLQARVEQTRDEVAAFREESLLFGELRDAFGKNGVQALLIDQALPELERIANDMLERMTGGRIQVRLETQRETRRGTPVETLDIRISDELGTRDYEMYSGGEAFRVDFALRIALSRLLAARAGASLPTLIIDEGFGTQDQEGIDRLVDAINAIQDDFRLILVVTHLEELKERFERRIEVTKDPQRGSLVRVV